MDLDKGAAGLSSGISEFQKGIEEELVPGSRDFADGLNKLNEGMKELSGRGEDLRKGAEALESGIFGIFTEVTNSLKKELSGRIPALEELLNDFQLTPDNYVEQIEKIKEKISGSSSLKDTQKAKINESLDGLKGMLDGIIALCDGVNDYTEGVESISSETVKLAEAADGLADGIQGVNDGAKELADGAGKLGSGTESFESGADELNKGMSEFDEEGIDKLVSSLNPSEALRMLDRFRALNNASKRTYYVGGVAPGMSGEARVIFKTAAIK